MPDDTSPAAHHADVLVVGSGIMGAVVARVVRERAPELRITMVDGGLPIGATPGVHLHDVVEPEIWETYNGRVASGIQGFYVGSAPADTKAQQVRDLEPGLHRLDTFFHDSTAMPKAAAAWNVGGMGVHWTAAVPWPSEAESFPFGDEESFAADLATAQRVLGSRQKALGPTVIGEKFLTALRERYRGMGPEDRAPQSMPMAVTPDGHYLRRTGPAVIFPPLGDASLDERFVLLPGTLAQSIDTDGGTATGVTVRDLVTGDTRVLEAAVVVVCADTFRTPQLLHASGIRPPALGRYLNEHAFITGRVLVDHQALGVALEDLPLPAPGEFATDSLWIPQNGEEQPFHGQIMNTTYVDDGGAPLAHAFGTSMYVPIESRPENRLRFVDDESDFAGLPRFEIEFDYSATDLALIDRARSELAELFRMFGSFDPETESMLLPPGSSLHQTGTVRMGKVDDGTSVCDTRCRVWGTENVYVAGNGVVPTAVAANATLTGAITAVRAARAVVDRIAPLSTGDPRS